MCPDDVIKFSTINLQEIFKYGQVRWKQCSYIEKIFLSLTYKKVMPGALYENNDKIGSNFEKNAHTSPGNGKFS